MKIIKISYGLYITEIKWNNMQILSTTLRSLAEAPAIYNPCVASDPEVCCCQLLPTHWKCPQNITNISWQCALTSFYVPLIQNPKDTCKTNMACHTYVIQWKLNFWSNIIFFWFISLKNKQWKSIQV